MGKHSKSRSYRPALAVGVAAAAMIGLPGTALAGGSTGVKPASSSTEGCYDIAVCVDTVDLDVVDVLDVAN